MTQGTRSGLSGLRYLHAIYAVNRAEIGGVISGPGIFWEYRLVLAGPSGIAQINVLTRRASQTEEARIQRRFLPEILGRVAQEQAQAGNQSVRPRYSGGEFYLRRGMPGSLPTHSQCVAAVSSGTLDAGFVARLLPWDFRLLNP